MSNIETGNIYNEDCMETMKRMDDNSVDLVITSPPYDNQRENKEYNADFDYRGIAESLFGVIKKGGVVVWVVADQTVDGSETGTSFEQALYFKNEIGFNLYDTMIYQKDGGTFPDPNRYFHAFEYMFVFSKGKPKTVNLIKDHKNSQAGKKVSGHYREFDGSLKRGSKHGEEIKESSRRYNIWKYSPGFNKSTKYKDAFEHPAIFPEELAGDHIKSWSNKSDVVYDPFTGSGTTQVMAERLVRKWLGSEVSEKYCKIARERVKIERDQLKAF